MIISISSFRVDLLSYAVSKNGFEEDDFLVGFASDTFLKGSYNEVILSYLCSYYHGATKELERIPGWQRGNLG